MEAPECEKAALLAYKAACRRKTAREKAAALLRKWEEEEARDANLNESARAAQEALGQEATRRAAAAAEAASAKEDLNMDDPPPDGTCPEAAAQPAAAAASTSGPAVGISSGSGSAAPASAASASAASASAASASTSASASASAATAAATGSPPRGTRSSSHLHARKTSGEGGASPDKRKATKHAAAFPLLSDALLAGLPPVLHMNERSAGMRHRGSHPLAPQQLPRPPFVDCPSYPSLSDTWHAHRPSYPPARSHLTHWQPT